MCIFTYCLCITHFCEFTSCLLELFNKLTKRSNHSFCCQDEFQGCCTTHYGDLHTSCVNRSSNKWMNECQSFCQFDISRHTQADSTFMSTCYKTKFIDQDKFIYSLSSSLFNESLVDPSHHAPPPQICTVGCISGCQPRDIGCRWNSTLHLPELYDVSTGAVISDDEPVVNYTGTGTWNDTAMFCYELNLPIGATGYRDAPSLGGEQVGCDESNLPYVINQSTSSLSLCFTNSHTLFHKHTHTTLGILLLKVGKTQITVKIFVLQRVMRTLDLSFN